MKKFVVLIGLKDGTPIYKHPTYGDYTHKSIFSVIPCTLENGVYTSWETGKQIKKTPNMLEWGLFSGDFFRLTDGREVLITRTVDMYRTPYLIEGVKYNPRTMRYHIARWFTPTED